MSDDGQPDPLGDPPMEVVVETLTGTIFDIRVYPTETILDIKNKIQRVEGIPVHHQNLLYQMEEMPDYAVLGESGITHGSILTLVLSVRGGPIASRRFTSCDHQIIWRDLKELIENSQTDIEPGSKVSVLVYKDGDVLNVLRVIENEDGSYSPYPDKSTQALPDPDAASTSAATNTNAIADATNGSAPNEDPIPPGAIDRTDAVLSSMAMPFGPVEVEIIAGGTPLLLVPSIEEYFAGQGAAGESIPSFLPHSDAHTFAWTHPYPHLRCEMLPAGQQQPGSDSKMAEALEMANKLQRLKRRMRHQRAMRYAKSSQPTARLSVAVLEDAIDLEELALKEKHRSRAHRHSAGGYLHNLHVFDPLPAYCELPEECTHPAHHQLRVARLGLFVPDPEQEMLEDAAAEQEMAEVAGAATACTSAQCKVERRASLDYDSAGADFGLGPLLEPTQEDPDDVFYRFSAMPRYTATAAMPPQPTPACVTRSPLYGRLSRNSNDNSLPPLAQSQSPSPELPGPTVSNIEDEQNDDFDDFPDLEELAFDYYDFGKYMASGLPPPGSLAASGLALDIGPNFYRAMDDEEEDADEIDEIEDVEEVQEIEEIIELGDIDGVEDVDGIGEVGELASEYPSIANDIERLTLCSDFQMQTEQIPAEVAQTPGATRDLPAVVAKKRMRCEQCNKRLNITNIYNCRCGLMFCAQHRNSEAHDCKYDYKAEGRRLIEKQNPVITASKLHKF